MVVLDIDCVDVLCELTLLDVDTVDWVLLLSEDDGVEDSDVEDCDVEDCDVDEA